MPRASYERWRDAFAADLQRFHVQSARSPRDLARELIRLVETGLDGPDAQVMLAALRSIARVNSRGGVAYAVLRAVSDSIPCAD